MISRIIYIVSFLILTINLFAQSGSVSSENNKNESPYFFVKCDNPAIDALPLLETTVDVNIAGVIADVTVRQVYKNNGQKPLEAIYVFPASTRAAVYDMTIFISDRVLKAVIKKKDDARKTYENAKKEGKSASLLEQDKPNVFTMNVANIMPGDTITVEMKYTELLIPEAGIYEFIYPTVVGPRYSSPNDTNSKQEKSFANIPYTKENVKPDYKWDISVNLNAGMPINEMSCATHKVIIEEKSCTNGFVKLDDSEKYAANKDFILQYKLRGDKIQSGLLLTENQKENFFLLMLQPPKRIEKKDIPKRDFVFVVDVSGSMNGFPLDISKNMMKKLLSKLNSDDLFNILFFSGGNSFLSENSLPATSDNIERAVEMLDKMYGGGGTELLPALTKVLSYPKNDGYSRIISIFTDGYVTVEEQAFDLIRNNLDKANFFAFGIGTSVNRYIIEGIAGVGNAVPFIATNKSQAEEISEKFYEYIRTPVMTNIQVQYDGFNVYDVEPKTIPDVLSDRPIIIFGKYYNTPNGQITVSGLSGEEKLKVELPVVKFASIDTGQSLKYLWARNKIAMLGDYINLYSYKRNDSLKIEEITNLGLKYNLLTKYTSFVAVDYVKRNNTNPIKVKQPLPMPERVNNLAIGNHSGYENSLGGIVNTGIGMQNIAREGISSIIGLNAGVFNSSDGFVVRGSRTNETQIRIDGLDVGDQFQGGFGSSGLSYTPFISQYATEEQYIYTGGFSAEYGNAPEYNSNAKRYIQSVNYGSVDMSVSSSSSDESEDNSVVSIVKEEAPEIDDFIAVNEEPYIDLEELQKKIVYPEMARRSAIEGKVVIRVLVGKNGKPIKAVVQESESAMLDEAAIAAIMKCTFKPAIQNGQPVACWVSIPVVFKLKK